MTSKRTPGRVIHFTRMYEALRPLMDGCTGLQWPLFLGAHMVKLVQSFERDADGRVVAITRAV